MEPLAESVTAKYFFASLFHFHFEKKRVLSLMHFLLHFFSLCIFPSLDSSWLKALSSPFDHGLCWNVILHLYKNGKKKPWTINTASVFVHYNTIVLTWKLLLQFNQKFDWLELHWTKSPCHCGAGESLWEGKVSPFYFFNNQRKSFPIL